METYFRSHNHFYPCCGDKGMDYAITPDADRIYQNMDGESVTEHMGETWDFKCRNCDCEFILVSGEVA